MLILKELLNKTLIENYKENKGTKFKKEKFAILFADNALEETLINL